MTVALVGTWLKWTGLSTDEKPLYDAPTAKKAEYAGSTFKELDTGVTWTWDGETWRVPEANKAVDQQLVELKEINANLLRGVELLTEIGMKLR